LASLRDVFIYFSVINIDERHQTTCQNITKALWINNFSFIDIFGRKFVGGGVSETLIKLCYNLKQKLIDPTNIDVTQNYPYNNIHESSTPHLLTYLKGLGLGWWVAAILWMFFDVIKRKVIDPTNMDVARN
jgi:hypothetical protein